MAADQSKACSICMSDFSNIVTRAANDERSAIAVFLDITKVFDRSHRKLLIKFKAMV